MHVGYDLAVCSRKVAIIIALSKQMMQTPSSKLKTLKNPAKPWLFLFYIGGSRVYQLSWAF